MLVNMTFSDNGFHNNGVKLNKNTSDGSATAGPFIRVGDPLTAPAAASNVGGDLPRGKTISY